MSGEKGEQRKTPREQYESLRGLLSATGFDPELAMEDEGYGIGISYPDGVHGPSENVARRLINMAKGLGPNGEPPPPSCRNCGRRIYSRQGRRKTYWLHADNDVPECHPMTFAEPIASVVSGSKDASLKDDV